MCITECVASDLEYVKHGLNNLKLEYTWLFPADDGKIQREKHYSANKLRENQNGCYL